MAFAFVRQCRRNSNDYTDCFRICYAYQQKVAYGLLGAVGKPVKKVAVTAKEKHAQHREEMEVYRLEQEQQRLQAESERKENL